jgi:predicted PhzF superfamily epimerase YddE/YHI9
MLETGQWIAASVFGADAAHGNPTVVVWLQDWPNDQELHALSRMLPADEVTVAVRGRDRLLLRWFGPYGEVSFCGHGALAAAALLPETASAGGMVATLGGPARLQLQLGYRDGLAALQMPATPLRELDPQHVDLGVPVVRLFDAGRDYLAVLPDEACVRARSPAQERLLALDKIGVVTTAPAAQATAAFRFFAPRAGIREDRASCSVLPTLAALWLGGRLDIGCFLQCAGIDIPLPVRRSGRGWLVTGPVHVTGQGHWAALQPSTIPVTPRKSPC